MELITTEEIMHVIDEYEIEFTHQNFIYIEKGIITVTMSNKQFQVADPFVIRCAVFFAPINPLAPTMYGDDLEIIIFKLYRILTLAIHREIALIWIPHNHTNG